MEETRKQIEGEIVEKAMKDEEFGEKLLSNPKETLEEVFGTKFPEEMNIHINRESANDIYITLPYITEELSERELSGVSGGGWFSGSSNNCNQNPALTKAIDM